MKRRLQSLGLVGMSVVLSLVLAEALFRLFPGFVPVDLRYMLHDRGIAHSYIGNVPASESSGTIWTRDFKSDYQVDKQGFRNSDPWPARPDIVVIGDSLVFGYGVKRKEAWPQVLSRQLSKRVVNLGLIGAGPQQYQRIYETFAEKLHPKIIIIGSFVANDFWDAEQFYLWKESGVGGNYLKWRDFGRPAAADLERPLSRMMLALEQHSYVANLFRLGAKALRIRSMPQPESFELQDGGTLRLDSAYLSEKTEYSRPGNEVFDGVLLAIKKIRDSAASYDARVVVVFQPSKEEIYLPFVGKYLPDPAAPIRAALTELDITCLDLAPAFRAGAEAGKRLYFLTDGHPNADGYRLIANQVTKYLQREYETEP